jgi:alkylation response protein AidB-like acyl-CoA dehydrogenase
VPEEWGGQGLPLSLGMIKAEMMGAANWAWSMYPGLSVGAMNTLLLHGSKEQKEKYLTRLASGEWSGTMCLTEPQCGTDLSQVKTKAEPLGDGRYKINGTKIWISAGDHDLTENIVHIVLARLPNAPAGTKGISLFVAPKYLIGADGKLDKSKRNVTCTALEKKMGIHGSATCVLSFEDTVGWLVGPEHAGLHAMFTFMNTARIGTAIQGLATCELAYQNSLPFAKERLAMRSLKGAQFPDKPADPIIVHPDVRRMMLTQKALAEGARAMCYDVSLKGAYFLFHILLLLTLHFKPTQCLPRRRRRSRSGSTLSWVSSRPSSRAF